MDRLAFKFFLYTFGFWPKLYHYPYEGLRAHRNAQFSLQVRTPAARGGTLRLSCRLGGAFVPRAAAVERGPAISQRLQYVLTSIGPEVFRGRRAGTPAPSKFEVPSPGPAARSAHSLSPMNRFRGFGPLAKEAHRR